MSSRQKLRCTSRLRGKRGCGIGKSRSSLLTGHWEYADFSVENVCSARPGVWAGREVQEDGGVSLRDWSIKLLSRYAYTFGKLSDSHPSILWLVRLIPFFSPPPFHPL